MWSVPYPYKYFHDLRFPLLAEHSRKEQPAWAGIVVAESARGQSLSWETDIQPPSEASSHFTVGKRGPRRGVSPSPTGRDPAGRTAVKPWGRGRLSSSVALRGCSWGIHPHTQKYILSSFLLKNGFNSFYFGRDAQVSLRICG